MSTNGKVREKLKKEWRTKALANGHKVTCWNNGELRCSVCSAAVRIVTGVGPQDDHSLKARLWKKCGVL